MALTTLLHVGLHKTASSSLQATCSKNSELLKSKGYNYPDLFSSSRGTKTDNHSVAIFNLFSASRYKYHVNAGKSVHLIDEENLVYKQKLLQSLLEKDSLILSAEDISDLDGEEQKKLAIYLSAFSGRLKTFAVIRSPYSLHCSAFAGMINNGRNLKPESFLSQVNKIKKLKTNFRKQGNIDEIRLIPFNEALQSAKGPVERILGKMGLSNLGNLVPVVSNEGLSNEQTRLQMMINSKNPRLINNIPNPSWRRAPQSKGPKFLLSQNELDLIMPKLIDENKWFEDQLGKGFCDKSYPTCD